MDIKNIYIAYFSPGLSTEQSAIQFAKMLGHNHVPHHQINLTHKKERTKIHNLTYNDLLVLAMPSHGGRVPVVTPDIFDSLKGSNTPSVIVLTYGCRGYDNQLGEIKQNLETKGFYIEAAVTIPTTHIISPQVGIPRPTKEDIKILENFANQIKLKIQYLFNNTTSIKLPGDDVAFEQHTPPPFVPVTNDKCIRCMLCYKWCPADAIEPFNPNETDADKCILCHGCIKRCPVSAREVMSEGFINKMKDMAQSLKDKNPSPELFIQ